MVENPYKTKHHHRHRIRVGFCNFWKHHDQIPHEETSFRFLTVSRNQCGLVHFYPRADLPRSATAAKRPVPVRKFCRNFHNNGSDFTSMPCADHVGGVNTDDGINYNIHAIHSVFQYHFSTRRHRFEDCDSRQRVSLHPGFLISKLCCEPRRLRMETKGLSQSALFPHIEDEFLKTLMRT